MHNRLTNVGVFLCFFFKFTTLKTVHNAKNQMVDFSFKQIFFLLRVFLVACNNI